MQVVTSYSPVAGQLQTLNLLQQSGFTEVINDSNMLLIIQTNNGQCYQVAGTVQIYPTPTGGGTFQIKAQSFYLAIDLGVANTITVNQYLTEELVGTTYPYFITRSVSPAVNNVTQVLQSTNVANLTAGMSVSTGASTLSPTSNFYLVGVDLNIDQESTAHGWTLTISGLFNTLTYVGHTKTAQDTLYSLRWYGPDALASAQQGANINVTVSVASITGSTSRASLNMTGRYQ